MKHRIACSILAVLGAAAVTQVPASAQETTLSDPGEVYEFGEPAVQLAPARKLRLEAEDPAPRATSACADGNGCFWKQAGYDGDRKSADSSWAQQDRFLGTYDRSAKNRFGSRKLTIKDIDFNVVGCIEAGGEDSNLPADSDIFRIGQPGSSC